MKLLCKTIVIVASLLLGGQLFAQRNYNYGYDGGRSTQQAKVHKTYDDNIISFNIRAGAVAADISGVDHSNLSFGAKLGVGADFRIPASPVYFQTGLDFAMKGAEGSGSSQVTTNYLQVPLHLAYKPEIAEGSKLMFFGGGYLGYGVHGKFKNHINDKQENAFDKGKFKPFDFGLSVGAGVEISRMILSCGLEWGLTNTSDNTIDPAIGNQRFWNDDTKNRAVYLTVGYRL